MLWKCNCNSWDLHMYPQYSSCKQTSKQYDILLDHENSSSWCHGVFPISASLFFLFFFFFSVVHMDWPTVIRGNSNDIFDNNLTKAFSTELLQSSCSYVVQSQTAILHNPSTFTGLEGALWSVGQYLMYQVTVLQTEGKVFSAI